MNNGGIKSYTESERNNVDINGIIELIKKSNNIVVTAHINPDGDAVGSGLALMLGIQKYKKMQTDDSSSVRFILQDRVPDTFKFLEGVDTIEMLSDSEYGKDSYINAISSDDDYTDFDEYDDQPIYGDYTNYDYSDFETMDTNKRKIDLLIALDSSNIDRIGRMAKLFSITKTTLNIDHHVSNGYYCDCNYMVKSSSTSEIIYDIMERLVETDGITLDKSIGYPIYTGISTDTGNFAYSNVSKRTLSTASKLMEMGVDNFEIYRNVYESRDLKTLKIFGEALSNMVYMPEKKFTYYFLDKDVYKKYDATKEHTEGVVNLINSHDGSSVALFIYEKEDGTLKGSLRSKDMKDDVNKIANLFGGGGHVKAAGFAVDSGERVNDMDYSITTEEKVQYIVDTILKNI